MKFRRTLSTFLAAAVVAGLLACPATAAEASSSFTDVTDAATAEAVEVLHALGVVNGTGNGLYQPDRSLTRAEFCKMALEVMGRGDEAASQSSRVIFSDVKADHWALGYINAAATKPSEEGTALVAGVGNGLFKPDDTITFGSAVAILLRALDYTDQDVGVGRVWYEGYLKVADSIGLTEGVSLSGDATVTRGQTAILLYNLLFTDLKGSENPYFTKLNATEEDSAIILSVDAVASDGTTGAVKTSSGVYKTDRAPFSHSLEGTRGKLVLDKNGKVLAIQPDTAGSDKVISVLQAEATYVKAADGEQLDTETSTPVYSANEDAKTYQDIWMDLRAGAQLTLHYSAAGKLEYIYLRTDTSSVTSMVASGSGTAQFSSLLAGSSGYSIYKNGLPASGGDIRQYDVATYDKDAKVLNISDLKLTGVLQNVYPNSTTPTQITMMNETFTVLPGASQMLSDFEIGETVTLLLTMDGRVAGAVSPSQARSTTVGVVKEVSGTTVTVEPLFLSGYEFTGTVSSASQATQMMGQLVTVSSTQVGKLSISRLSASGSSGDAWNVQAGTIGDAKLAGNVRIYERVGSSKLFPVDLEDVTCATVAASKLLYVGEDYAGRVTMLVLDNVTGDHYTYGFLNTGSQTTGTSLDGGEIKNSTVTVSTKGDVLGSGTSLFGSAPGVKRNTPGGIIASLDQFGGSPKVAGYVLLESIKGVPRSAFTVADDKASVTVDGVTYPVADNVVCYNEAAALWFESLADARAFSNNLTLYYDRAPEDGGKIRLIVAEA